ncbi:MAG: polysaccharide biosynthesis tyrosine autokinase [candidate division KSB1 bacterium]|nr:polysaccharide biosynthesis tyrosine autokinase [candidate division KSB1 bacterium]
MQEPMQPQTSLKDYVRVLYRSRWLILICFLAVVGSTAFFTFRAEPIYQASAKLMIQEGGGVSRMVFDVTGFVKKETMINNQMEILKSRSVAERVIASLETSPYAGQLRILGNDPGNHRGKNSRRLGILRSSEPVSPEEAAKARHESAIKAIQRGIKVTAVRNSDMINVSFEAPSPFEAAFVTNTIVDEFKKFNQAQSQAEVRQVKQFLEEQLALIQEQLSRSEEALRAYKERERVVALDKETAALVDKVAQFETLLKEAQTALAENKERLKFIDEQLAKSKQHFDIDAVSASPYLQELKRQLAEKEASLAVFMGQLVEVGALEEKRSDIQLRQKQIEALKEKFKEEVTRLAAAEMLDPMSVSTALFQRKIEVETELQSLQPRVEALQAIVNRFNREMETLPEKALELARLQRAAQVDEKLYVMLQEKYQESRITEVGQLGNVIIIDRAQPPVAPIKPKKRVNLMLGAIIGLMLGFGLAFVIEYLDTSVRSIEDVEAMGLNLMGTIPVIRAEQRNGRAEQVPGARVDPETRQIEERLVTHLRPKSPVSESYRTLRTNIQFARSDAPVRALLVTSAGPKEGKSTTVANLAITMAQLNTRTLLVDADLRRPMLHKLFGVPRDVGLTNLLVGKAALDQALIPTPVENLTLMPCGVLPPNPSELLGSQAMQALLNEVKGRFDVVLLDSPPVIAVTDALVLGRLVDGVLLVVSSGSTNREALMRAKDLLDHVQAPVLGVLLNNITASNMYGSYYYYYYYHYYYYGDGEKKKEKVKKRRHRGSEVA